MMNMGPGGIFTVAWWIAMAAVLAWVAQRRGEKPVFWLVFSLVASPLLAVLFLMALPEKK
jgi:hypothetical protein